MTPTPEQEAIVQAALREESIMVEALAGCAKTTTIELLVRALPSSKRVLILAFNVKIKQELESRLKDLPNVKVQTANGLGASVLYSSRIRTQINTDKIYSLSKAVGLRGDDLADLMQLVRSARMAGILPRAFVGKPLMGNSDQDWIQLALDQDIDPVLTAPAQDILEKSTTLALKGEIDFDDQLYLSACMLGGFPKYDLVVADEAQDLSPINHAQIARFGKKPQLIMVGDSHQAIYAWRGADSQSMTTLRGLRDSWTDLTLSITFRCPKTVVLRQQKLVPHFQAAESNLEGEVASLKTWTPQPGEAILCRNNAPIIKTAFRLLRRGIPAQVLGTDIGRNLKRLYNKLSDHGKKSREEIFSAAEKLRAAEPKKTDQVESLLALLENHPSLDKAIQTLLSSKTGVALATGHRAKGLEWPVVYHLEPQLIPSKHCTTEEEFQQERNLRYVIETRTKDKLYSVQQEGLR